MFFAMDMSATSTIDTRTARLDADRPDADRRPGGRGVLGADTGGPLKDHGPRRMTSTRTFALLQDS